jgi:hypothetical protein
MGMAEAIHRPRPGCGFPQGLETGKSGKGAEQSWASPQAQRLPKAPEHCQSLGFPHFPALYDNDYGLFFWF